jgi:hypothetical protein
MRLRRLGLLFAAACAALVLAGPARATLLISIDKSAQRMTVTVDGQQRYQWPVSTGARGYDTPAGEFQPFRMEREHYSEEWDDAPMPYSIFFTKIGHAIHGSYEVKHLGTPVSHGCVRLLPKNAAILFDLVKKEGMKNTQVVLSGEIPGGPGMPVARRQPSQGRDEDAAAPLQLHSAGGRAYDDGPRYYYDGREPRDDPPRYQRAVPPPPLLLPFPFPFGR